VSDQLRRLGALRAIAIVILAAAASVATLSASGLSVGATEEPVVTVRPQLPVAAAATAPPRVRDRGRRHRSAATVARPDRKRCRPVNGVVFTVSAGTSCPTQLKRRRSGGISGRLRQAARRPRVTPPTQKPAPNAAPAAPTKPTSAVRGQTPTMTATPSNGAAPVAPSGGTPAPAPGTDTTASGADAPKTASRTKDEPR
jgi:hypothetical protein